ncbi:MAG: amidohydrolase family protein, partial [Syntrophorhabdaceae bacterium]|nr:amidohydrolase family protein [Syntrophorhabdaceae bacterium]
VVIVNGRIVNVFTDEILEGHLISIKNGFIVSVEEANRTKYDEKVETIDAEGMYLVPGFIDAHTHLDSMYRFSELPPYAIKGGTTTVITECAMAANACGMEGVLSFIDSTKGYPVRCYFLAPPLVPPFPDLETSKGLSMRDFVSLLKREDFVGIGEAYWTRVVDGDDRILKQSTEAIRARKRLDGHSSGARGNKIVQYILTGITSCHESVTVEEALEKLRHGLYVMIREGFVRKELKELSGLKDYNIDKRRLIFVSDVFDPVMLVNEGYLDSIVRKAIQYGFEPIDAIKMVTINPAEYYGLRFLGAIAPFRYGDILFIDNLNDVRIKKAIFNGKLVYSDNEFKLPLPKNTYPEGMLNSLNLEKMEETEFLVKREGSKGKIRVEELINDTISKEYIWEPPIRDGIVQNDLEKDVISAAVIFRGNKKRMGKGFIKGTGIKEGAVATTLIWDTCNVLVVGSNTKDMAISVNRLIDIKGGVVIVKNGQIIYELPMPAYGLIPLDTMEELNKKLRDLDAAMNAIGSSIKRPFLTIQVIPFTGLPFLRITDKGMVDVKKKSLVSLFVD